MKPRKPGNPDCPLAPWLSTSCWRRLFCATTTTTTTPPVRRTEIRVRCAFDATCASEHGCLGQTATSCRLRVLELPPNLQAQVGPARILYPSIRRESFESQVTQTSNSKRTETEPRDVLVDGTPNAPARLSALFVRHSDAPMSHHHVHPSCRLQSWFGRNRVRCVAGCRARYLARALCPLGAQRRMVRHRSRNSCQRMPPGVVSRLALRCRGRVQVSSTSNDHTCIARLWAAEQVAEGEEVMAGIDQPLW